MEGQGEGPLGRGCEGREGAGLRCGEQCSRQEEQPPQVPSTGMSMGHLTEGQRDRADGVGERGRDQVSLAL